MKRHSGLHVALGLLLLAALMQGCRRQQAPPPPPTPEVGVMTVAPQRVVLTTHLPGRTCAFRVAQIRPQVNGLVQKRLFTEGATVQAGDVLYQIDPAPFEAALDNALANLDAARKGGDRARAGLVATIAGVSQQKATLDLARTNRKRIEELFEMHAVSASDRDQAVTGFEVAQAALQAAEAQVETGRQAIAAADAAGKQAEAAVDTVRINLAYTRICAPISGLIGRSTVTDGALVTAYQPVALATIQQLDPIYVDLPQSTSDLLGLKSRLTQGRLNHADGSQDSVHLSLEDGTAYPQAGTLQFREVSVDPTTGSVILRAVFPNPDATLLPGMFVQAAVEEGTNDQAILVPQQAVMRDPKGNPFALVVGPDEKVVQQPLELERAMGSQWLVRSGLSAGQRVIVEGSQRVRPGATVRAVAADAAGQLAAVAQNATQPAGAK